MSLPGTPEQEEEEGAHFGIIHFGRACFTHTHACPSLFMSILDQSNAPRDRCLRPEDPLTGEEKEGRRSEGGAWGSIKGAYLSQNAHIQCVGKVGTKRAHLSFIALLRLKVGRKFMESINSFSSFQVLFYIFLTYFTF